MQTMQTIETTKTNGVEELMHKGGDIKPSPQDRALLRDAKEHLSYQRYLHAARSFAKVSDPQLLNKKDMKCIEMAQEIQEVLDELLEPPLDDENHAAHGWIKQEETHSDKFDSQIFYRVDRDHKKKSSAIFCRIESPIDDDMLVPLMAVLNESDFYSTWMPNYEKPIRLKVQSSQKLREMDRGNQLIAVRVDMPFPFSCRECIMHAFSVDDIDDSRSIIIKVKSVNTDPGVDLDDSYCGSKVSPQVDKGVIRVDFEAGFLIRKCPPSHVLLTKAKHKYTNPLLISVTQCADAHVGMVPMSMINFFTKSVVGKMWQSLLTVAQEIRDGKRPEHAKAVEAKGELYDWVKQRVHVLVQNEDASGAASFNVGLASTELRTD
ncbi:hypothetical protein MPSEU_000565300 [Mayamaea pseudoterrestris]|nr:hypothetical protein MPSEU_000565300 [Mayamaea pseudoterrestris]